MFEDGGQEGEVEGNKLDTVAVVELVLELNPKIKHSGRRAHLVTTKTEHRLKDEIKDLCWHANARLFGVFF